MSSDQQWDIVTGVGLTALAVAAGRAAESARPDALISDPYASRLVAAAQAPAGFPFSAGQPDEDGTTGSGEAEDALWAHSADYMGLRSRVFDDYFLLAAEDGIGQMVILASGLDTRPFRLSWPAGTVCFELDQPAVLDFKSATLEAEDATPACDHRPVPIDLRHDWGSALEAAGFDSSLPTAWLAEGLLPYLTPEAETRLFREISRLSPSGSRLAVEHVDNVTDMVADSEMRARADAAGLDILSLFPDGEREPVEKQLGELGWQLEKRDVRESSAAHGRPVPDIPMFTEHVTHVFGRLT